MHILLPLGRILSRSHSNLILLRQHLLPFRLPTRTRQGLHNHATNSPSTQTQPLGVHMVAELSRQSYRPHLTRQTPPLLHAILLFRQSFIWPSSHSNMYNSELARSNGACQE